MKYERILRAVGNQPWAIMPEKAEQIMAFLEFKAMGGTVPREEIDHLRAQNTHVSAAAATASGATGDSVAVLPLVGIIHQRATLFDDLSSGGGSTAAFTRSFREAMAAPNVKAVIIDVDSPGGGVYGVDELSAEIFNARGSKPIVAVANSLMASAAYYVASAADEIVVTPGGEVGSIGVFAMHFDYSAQDEMMGVKPSLVKAGKYKAEMAEDFPLSEEAAGHLQEDVDRYYRMFVDAVARNRGMKADDVRGGMGQGRVVGAKDAVRLDMADRVATLDETIDRFLRGGRVTRRASAENEGPSIGAEDEPPTDDTDLRRRRLRQRGLEVA